MQKIQNDHLIEGIKKNHSCGIPAQNAYSESNYEETRTKANWETFYRRSGL